MSIKALSDFRTDLLVCTNNVSEVFRIELGCQLGRFDEVDKHYGELATFRVWGMRCCWRRFALGRCLCLGSRLLSCQCGLRDGFLGVASPDQHGALFVHGKAFGFDHFVFEVFEILVIEVKPSFQGTIRDTLLTLEQFEYLVEDFIEGHKCPSAVWVSPLCERLR